ncbi:Hypothetical predicted protein [Paramuricea clavata]|uniref:Uncharacterized protein n=1 Tax=Paramuricea clavata TaxID=317549 RepID=A0A7D9LAF9_PARCT|nr:Hypothetical predicted protein [Paramuricea clavata]
MTEIDRDQAMTDEMLRKFSYKKLLRVTAYMIRFMRNAKGEKWNGLLKTEEILNAERLWLRHVQRNVSAVPNVDLQKDKDDVLRVNSRIPGYRPAFIPRRCCLDRILVSDIHEQIGHGGVSSTMAKVREQFWIPQLRVLVKSVIHECKEEIEHPILTPNLLIHGTSAHFLEEDLEALDEKDLITKRINFLKNCRQQLRKRWQTEYLHALEERHRKIVGKDKTLPSKGSVVMITDNSKTKSKWQVGRIVDTIQGKDGVLRGYKIKTGTGYVVERPIQLVCNLEIKVCKDNEPSKKRDHIENKVVADQSQDVESKRRPQRKAKSAAINVIKGVSLNELED